MSELPAFGLANTVTGFATLFAGLTCLALAHLLRPQPARWHFAYWTIVATGVLTVTLHGFGETVSGFGPRWIWGFLDTGSNIVVAWALAVAVLGDYYGPAARARGRAIVSAAMAVGLVWHLVDQHPATASVYLIPLGEWGGFKPGETWLIALSVTVVGLFYARRERIPSAARPILTTVVAIFLCGLGLATASNDRILYPFFALHALWHLVGAVGFVMLWAFNHARFEAEAGEGAQRA